MGLIHWWPLSGNLNDYGENPKPGVLVGSGSVTSSTGKTTKYSLSGMSGSQTTAGASVADCNLLGELGTEYSAAAWVYLNGTHVNYAGTIMSSGNWNNDRWAFGVKQDNTQIMCLAHGHNSYVKTKTAMPTGKWLHIASVYKKGKAYAYLNGELQGSVNATPPNVSTASNLCIGRETYANGYFSLNGRVNDLRVYNHALSQKEIRDLFNACVVNFNFSDPNVGTGESFANSTGYDEIEYQSDYDWYSGESTPRKDATNNGVTFTDSDTICGKYAAVFNGSSYIKKPAGLENIQTITTWAKVATYPTTNTVVFADGKSKLAFGFYSTSGAIITCGTSVRYVSNAKSLWKEGKWNHIAVTKDDEGAFHCYINGTECSYTGSNSWTHNLNDLLIGCRYTSTYESKFTGKLANFRIYAGCLTADQVKSEARSGARLLNNHSVQADLIEETSANKAGDMNKAIFRKTWTNGVSYYNQANCTNTLTDDGFRIYRPANCLNQTNGGTNNMYGGMKLQFLTLGHIVTKSYTNSSTGAAATYEESDFFQKGHKYRISFHVKGFSNNSPSMGFTNYMGWGGGGLSPAPTSVESTGIPENFGIVNGEAVGAEKDCYYIFTINDDVYKTCTSAYSSFVLGNIYPSYKDFQLQFSYTNTGQFGTDLYITNIVCEDITDSNPEAMEPTSKRTLAFGTISTHSDDAPISKGQASGVTSVRGITEVGEILAESQINADICAAETNIQTLNLNSEETKFISSSDTIQGTTTPNGLVTCADVYKYLQTLGII